MASTDDFFVTVRGRGGHASTPHFANDPIPVAAEMITALQTFVTRRVNAFDPAVITVGHLTAGTTVNVIPETARLRGNDPNGQRDDPTRCDRRLRAGGAGHRGSARLRGRRAAACRIPRHGERRGVRRIRERGRPIRAGRARATSRCRSPIMGAEDFSYVLQQVPGAMFFLGVCPDDIAEQPRGAVVPLEPHATQRGRAPGRRRAPRGGRAALPRGLIAGSTPPAEQTSPSSPRDATTGGHDERADDRGLLRRGPQLSAVRRVRGAGQCIRPVALRRGGCRPRGVLGASGTRARQLVQGLRHGARVGAPVREVVRRRHPERQLQLPRPPRRGRRSASGSRSTGRASRATSAR